MKMYQQLQQHAKNLHVTDVSWAFQQLWDYPEAFQTHWTDWRIQYLLFHPFAPMKQCPAQNYSHRSNLTKHLRSQSIYFFFTPHAVNNLPCSCRTNIVTIHYKQWRREKRYIIHRAMPPLITEHIQVSLPASSFYTQQES